MTSLADRLAAASRDRATLPRPTTRWPPYNERRGRGEIKRRERLQRPQGQGAQHPAAAARPEAVRRRAHPDRARAHGQGRAAGGHAGRGHPAHHRRAQPHLPGDRRRHPRLRPDRAVPPRPGPHRGDGQRTEQHLHRAWRPAGQGRGSLHRRGAPTTHDRQDRLAHRSPRRRVQPDGGRPPARRQPRQRGDPAARRGRLAAHDPKVLGRPVHHRRPRGLRHLLPAHGRLPVRLRQGTPQHHRLRQHRLGEDDHAERALVVHPLRRAHRHDRGRCRAAAPPGPRAAARVPTVEHRGQGRGRDPRPRQEHPAHAARPHRRR